MEKIEDFKVARIIAIAKDICLAAKTAPKGKGIDLLVGGVISGEGILRLSHKMKEIGAEYSHPTFLRDGENIKKASAIILLGTKIKPLGLKLCGFCGFKDCQENQEHHGICAFNPGDLGIAIGSAVSQAMDYRLDNRIMYTVGFAALKLNLLGEQVSIAYGIPLSVSSKNPFFDRQ